MTFICVYIVGGLKTKVRNLTEEPIDLQIRVGSTLKNVYTLRAGKVKTLDCRKMYMSYAPSRSHGAAALYYDESCQPYVWIHNPNEFGRMVKQQYMSLEDLRDFSEIKIYKEPGRCSLSVYKKPRVPRFFNICEYPAANMAFNMCVCIDEGEEFDTEAHRFAEAGREFVVTINPLSDVCRGP